MKRVLAAAVLLPLTMAAGCGGGGSGSHSHSTSPAPSAAPFPKAAAQTAASSALLTISDFPSGWSSSKGSSADTASDKKFSQQLADCLHAPPGILGSKDVESAHADSPDFDAPDGDTTISESVSVSRSSRVGQLFTVLHQDNATDCVSTTANAYVKQELAKNTDPDVKQASFGAIQVGRLSTSQYGDDTAAMRATLPVTIKGLTVNIYLDLVFVRHANAAASLTFVGEGTPVDAQTTAKYAKLAADKLARTNLPTA